MLKAWARVGAILAVATLLVALPAAQGFLATASDYTVAVQATPVYGLYKISVAGLAGGITAAAADLYSGVEYIAGSGYLAALNVPAREVLWAQSLEGTAILAAVDSTANASAVAVATDAGEVVVVSALSGDVLATYYVGQDSPVESISLLRSPDGLKLAVLTADGYLRLYRVGSPYWLEIGPSPGQEPLRSLAGVVVSGAYPVANVSDWWEEASTETLLLRYTISNQSLRPSLLLDVYYLNGSTEQPAYTHAGLSIGDSEALYATLQVWPLVEPFNTLEPWEPAPYTGNATVNVTGLYPGEYRIVAVYNYTVVNTSNGQVIESHCYYGALEGVALGLGESRTLNLTLIETAACPSGGFAKQDLEAYLALNTTSLPENFTPAKLKPLLTPKPPGSLAPSIVKAVLATEPPPGWSDYNATGVLVAVYNSNNSDVRLTYLASNTTPVTVNGTASEYMVLEAPVSAIALSPSLDRLYLGTSVGTLYLARWLPSEGRYVASNSIEATGDQPIASIQPTPWNVTIAVGSGGAAQAVSEEDWQPIWRGGPGYPGLQLPLEGSAPLQVFTGPSIPLTIVPSLAQDTAPWLLAAQAGLWSTPPLSRVQVNLTVLLQKLDGTIQAEDPGSGSYVAAYANGTLIASAPAEDGLATLYLAPGNYTLLINATAWGAAEANLTVNTTDVAFQTLLEFREVEVEVYTPPGPEPGYQLVSGPVAGAALTAEPQGWSGTSTLKPLAGPVNASTDASGTALMVLWSQLNYTLTAEKEGYLTSFTQLPAGGPENITLPLYPQLYPVVFTVLDAGAASAGINYTTPDAVLVISNGRKQLSLQAPNGSLEVQLPAGTFLVQIQAPGYLPASAEASVPLNDSITIYLQPETYQLTVQASVSDVLTSLASGPLAGAQVTLTLLTPPIPGYNVTLVTGANGVASTALRYGVYNLTVTHPYTQPYSAVILVNSTGTMQVIVEPKYTNLTVAAYDSQLQSLGILAPNASITLVYAPTGRALTVQAPNGTTSVVVPYGPYQLTASAPHYYPYGPAGLELQEPRVEVDLSLNPVFYQVTVTVVVNDTLTGLASGPLVNAEVQAVLAQPVAPWINSTAYTGPGGEATLMLRYGVYNLTVTHPYTQPITVTLRVEGPGAAALAAEPRYATLTVIVYDSELYPYGVTASNATLTITYASTGRSLSLELPTGTGSALVPYGLYTVEASAPFYYPSQPQTFAVTEPAAQFSVYLTPIKYQVTVKLVVDDPLWGLATGPAAGALVNFTIIQPSLPVPPVTGYTNQQGEVTVELRAGTYRVSIVHPIAANAQFNIAVGADTSATYTLHPDYADVEISAVDGETGLPIPGAVVVLTYTSMGAPRSVSITLATGVEELQLPPGSYQLSVSEWHYYQASGSFTLNKGASASIGIHMQPIKVDVSVSVYSNKTEAGGLVLPSRPLSGALVVLEPSDPVLQAVGAPPVSGTTSGDGTVHFTLRIGSYLINITRTHYVGVEGVQLITSSRTLEFTLTPILYNVTLAITDPEMLPGYRDLYNVTLRVDYWDGYPVGSTITVDSGDTIALPAGVYQLTLSKTHYDTAQYTLAVSGNVTIEIPLNATLYPVSITVTAKSSVASGAVAGVTVALVSSLPLENNVFTAVTDAGGVASLSLRAGNYTVLLLGPGYQQPHTLGHILVEGPASASFAIQPPMVNLSVSVADAEYPIPVNATLELAYTGPYGTGSLKVRVNGSALLALPAGSYVVTATADRYKPASLPVLLNASSESVRITLQPVLVPVTINVYDGDGNPVDGAVVRLVYEIPSLSPPPIITVNGTAKPREGVRIGAYRVEVSPPPGSPLLPAAVPLDVRAGGGQVTITLPFRNFTVEIILKDSLTGRMVPFKYLVKLQRAGKGSETLRYPKEVEVVGGKANVTLPYGVYTVLLEPEAQDYYVVPQGITFHAEREGQQVVIQMKPRVYTVNVVVVDDRSRPVAGALVELVDTKTHATVASQLTDSTGSASFSVVYGLYEIKVTHKAYKEATAYIQVPQVTSTTVNVYPTPITALKRMAPLIVGVAGLALLGAVLWRAKEAIAARLAEQEEYF